MESDGYPTAEDGYNEDADGSYAMSTVTGTAADPTNAEGKNTLYIADTFFLSANNRICMNAARICTKTRRRTSAVATILPCVVVWVCRAVHHVLFLCSEKKECAKVANTFPLHTSHFY